MRKLADKQLANLKKLGWDFLPTGPNEFDWLKFDKDGNVIARGGDATWAKDSRV
jgi:hypothetical protein